MGVSRLYTMCDVFIKVNCVYICIHRVRKKGTDTILAVTVTSLDNQRSIVFDTNHPDNPCDCDQADVSRCDEPSVSACPSVC